LDLLLEEAVLFEFEVYGFIPSPLEHSEQSVYVCTYRNGNNPAGFLRTASREEFS
jgi:hypothetical protein